ncbi:MAG: CAP domain-containing protein, partial [Geminicoccales bacterium]
MSRPCCGAYAATLLVAFWLSGPAAAADDQRRTLEGYATWASATLEAPPAGVRLLEPLERRLVELTAERRREAGADLEPLQTDPDLLPAARAHALDMLERGYVDHVTPGGHDPSDRVALLHRRLVGGVGENLAEHEGLSAEQLEGQIGPLAVKIMDGLMQSPGHRENILSPDYTHLAIAAAAKGERVVLV